MKSEHYLRELHEVITNCWKFLKDRMVSYADTDAYWAETVRKADEDIAARFAGTAAEEFASKMYMQMLDELTRHADRVRVARGRTGI